MKTQSINGDIPHGRWGWLVRFQLCLPLTFLYLGIYLLIN
jgi:hypothetical protein